jgi:Na+-translocating ferredoxin:NAD+ oxidoreductase RNF subunit RnfB
LRFSHLFHLAASSEKHALYGVPKFQKLTLIMFQDVLWRYIYYRIDAVETRCCGSTIMDPQALIVAVLIMAGLGVALSTGLAIANKKLYVWEDPRIGDVEEMLPATNCGACGQPGCRAFAEQVVAGAVSPGQCTVSTAEGREKIAEYLGVDVGAEEKRVARLACAGGTHVARQRVAYRGLDSCRAANLVAGGGKGCAWGCLGLADCEAVCDFDAITMDAHGLPDCVDICPKGLFEIHPVSHRLWVACKSEAHGDAAEIECEVACNACTRCVADAGPGLIEMKNNLAVIDYAKNTLASKDAIQRCPTGAIVWVDETRHVTEKGEQAKKIVRQHARPIG